MAFIYLILAIVAEVIATSALKASAGFTGLRPAWWSWSATGWRFIC